MSEMPDTKTTTCAGSPVVGGGPERATDCCRDIAGCRERIQAQVTRLEAELGEARAAHASTEREAERLEAIRDGVDRALLAAGDFKGTERLEHIARIIRERYEAQRELAALRMRQLTAPMEPIACAKCGNPTIQAAGGICVDDHACAARQAALHTDPDQAAADTAYRESVEHGNKQLAEDRDHWRAEAERLQGLVELLEAGPEPEEIRQAREALYAAGFGVGRLPEGIYSMAVLIIDLQKDKDGLFGQLDKAEAERANLAQECEALGGQVEDLLRRERVQVADRDAKRAERDEAYRELCEARRELLTERAEVGRLRRLLSRFSLAKTQLLEAQAGKAFADDQHRIWSGEYAAAMAEIEAEAARPSSATTTPASAAAEAENGGEG